jgi:hypothetical protein
MLWTTGDGGERSVLDLSDVGRALDTIAMALRSRWASALEHGDFEEVTRIVEASHAVHRAAVALTGDTLLPARGRADCALP